MKKILAILSILLLTFGMAFGATETSTVTLKATVGETSNNTGLRVKAGDVSSDVLTPENFDTTWGSATDNTTITTGDISVGSATGFFSVLFKRVTDTEVTVDVTAQPMKRTVGASQYIGYKIKTGNSIFLDTTSIPSVAVNKKYTANHKFDDSSKIIRDTKIFEYEIPLNTAVPLGEYEATIQFSVTSP